jgi:uncharacterized protein with FMN-binding domain
MKYAKISHMEPNQNSKQGTFIKIIAGIVVLGLAGFAFAKSGNKTTEESSALRPEDTTTEPQQPSASTGTYKNGTYTSTGVYKSPAGEESVKVSLTIENDVVTNATFVGNATNPGSVKNQGLFSEGYKQYVVGKKIDAISLDVVNGSSLTPKGFMDAVQKIKAQARA